MPITSNAEPALVNFPKSAIANGQIDGHIIALASPSKAINNTLVNPDVNKAANVKITPKTAETASALSCFIMREW